MPAAMLTRDELAAQITAARAEVRWHERCGAKARCRDEAAAEVDRLLDLYPRG